MVLYFGYSAISSNENLEQKFRRPGHNTAHKWIYMYASVCTTQCI